MYSECFVPKYQNIYASFSDWCSAHYLKTFCYKGGKIKNTYILLDGLVCRVSMDIFMSTLSDICTRGFEKLNKLCIFHY